MNFTSNMLGVIDPTHGLLSNHMKPDKAAGAASKATLKAAGMVPGLGMLVKHFTPKSNPNTAGLKDEAKAHVQVNGGNYDNTVQAQKFKQTAKVGSTGIAAATLAANRHGNSQRSIGDYGIAKPGGCVVPKSAVNDLRKLKSPLELDSKLAGML